MKNIKELEELYELLLDIEKRGLKDDQFYNILPEIFNEDIGELVSRLQEVLDDNGYFDK